VKHKPVIILGAGGHAKVVAEALKLSERDILGFVTPDLKTGSEFCGKKVLGDDQVINNYFPDNIELVNGIGSLPRKKLRWKLADKMRAQGYSFTTVIHPDATISSDLSLSEGVQIMAGVVIQSGSIIGHDTIINTGVLIDHDCKIFENCHLAPGVVCSGGIVIGENTHIGTGSLIINNLNIGKNCIIAAGSIIFKDIGSNTNFIQNRKSELDEKV
jgi:sugar O-acyltransferase (sialic acid O-acetyltransferase NeuD family)